uniref:Uncharacterized protein n=1 Tax=viral metagenome TaxID=1070528 RepID=A0A6C0BLD8_9ZZZZ
MIDHVWIGLWILGRQRDSQTYSITVIYSQNWTRQLVRKGGFSRDQDRRETVRLAFNLGG